MKCTTTKELLQEPLSALERVASKQATLPVLQCVLLSVEDDVLTLRATNLEVGAERSLPATQTEAGTVAVSAAVFAGVVSSLPSGSKLTLSSQGSNLTLTTSTSTARLTLFDHTDFPTLPRVEGGVEVELPPERLRQALSAVVGSASTSTIKPELASVFVECRGTELVAAATDSFRLAEKSVVLPKAYTLEPFLIPARNVGEFLKTLERVEKGATLTVGEHQLSLSAPGLYFTTRLTPGTFPDYTKIIPTEFATEATLLRFDLEQSLRKVAVFSNSFNQTVISLDPQHTTLTFHTENATVGEVTDTLAAALQGKALTISFNHRYLLEAFGPLSTDSVTLGFKGPGQPMLIRGVGDSSYRYLVMPMNR